MDAIATPADTTGPRVQNLPRVEGTVRPDSALRIEGATTVSSEILAILCPDWRTAALVIDATNTNVVFANSQCIAMLRREQPMRLMGDRLDFTPCGLNRRFNLELAQLASSGGESAFIYERDVSSGDWLSVVIRNGQGFFRDAIETNLGKSMGPKLMIVEIATGAEMLDRNAFSSFAQTATLSKAEAELVKAVAAGWSLTEAAQSRGTAVSTIRQRMKSILSKTGCRRQSELVHLVLSICPRRSY